MIAPDSGLPSGVWGHPAQRHLLARGRSVVDQCSLYLLYSQEPPQPCQVPPGLSPVTRVRVRRAWKNRPEWSTMTWDCNGVGGKTLWCFWIKIKKMKTAHDKCGFTCTWILLFVWHYPSWSLKTRRGPEPPLGAWGCCSRWCLRSGTPERWNRGWPGQSARWRACSTMCTRPWSSSCTLPQ